MATDLFDFDEVIDRTAVPALKSHPIVLGEDGQDLFPAGVADMDFRVAPAILDAMRVRVEHGIFGYETVPSGLFRALIDWQASQHGWKLEAEHILRSPNVLNALAITVSLFSNPGDGVIVQPPVFFDFFDIIAENNRRLVENPLLFENGRYEMDFDGLEKLAADPNNKILFLCNPHNPVGRVWQRDELLRLSEICLRHNVLVASDELHGDITFKGHRYTPFAALGPEQAANSISFLSPAKSFNIAGVCWSFTCIANQERRARFQVENSRLTANKNNAFSSVAMEAAYRDGEPWLQAALSYLQGNLELVREELVDTEVDLIEPEGTFLLWLDFRSVGLSPEELTAFLRTRCKWAVSRGIAFGSQGAGFARLNIACPRPRLHKALGDLRRALEDRA